MHIYEGLVSDRATETALYILGKDEEVRAFNRSIGSCLLGAAAHGAVSDDEAMSLSNTLVYGWDITGKDREVFMEVYERAVYYNNVRHRAATHAAISGRLSTTAWLEEMSTDVPDVSFVEAGGLLAKEVEEGYVPDIQPISELTEFRDATSYTAKMAATEGYSHFGWQTEVVPTGLIRPSYRELSDREHISLGNVLPDGTYDPMLTILNANHPALLGRSETDAS